MYTNDYSYTTGGKVKDPLKTLAMPQSLALGYRSDWAARLGAQIAERAPFGHELVLPRNQVGELLECTGLWRGERRCENSPFISQSILQAQLTKRLCREWLRETGTEVGLWPFQFVGQALNDFDSMTLPIRQWIGQHTPRPHIVKGKVESADSSE